MPSEPPRPSRAPVDVPVDPALVETALDDMLVGSLRQVCVGLAFFFALLAGWYAVYLQGTALNLMGPASALMSVGMLAAAVWFERNRLPSRFANPVAGAIAFAVVAHSLLLLVAVPEPQMTTNLLIAQLGFGCLLLSVRWFVALAAVSLAGWLWIVGARRIVPEWYHFGVALVEGTAFGLLVLLVRIRAYRNLGELRLRDRQLVRKLEDANEAALVAVKAKSQFLANMSHEIRTPMTAMLGMTELLQMTELEEDQKSYADAIARGGDTLLTLVNDILDFSKIEAGLLALEDVRLNLERLCQDVQGMLQVRADRAGLSLTVDYPEDLPRRFRGDPTRLQQVIVNLVGNAIKFTQQGGVTIRVRGDELPSGQWSLRIDVVDTGIGIEQDSLEQIFEAFTQADASTTRKFGGTGLGLAISNQLVRLMGGTLTVDSALGEGSTFTVAIRLSVDGALSTIPAPDEGLRTDFDADVLLVEDNPENQKLAMKMLSNFGCRVDLVDNGLRAVEAAVDKRYDLVFMDCQMAGMNGYDATRTIREREGEGEHVTIVALTANVLPEERALCISVGMDDHVSKPFGFKDLHAVLDRWL